MNVLLTGGTGYIGQALCPQLLASGHELHVYSRQPGNVKSLCGEPVTGFDDLSRVENEPFDAVINLAGAPIAGWPWTRSRKQKLRDSRIALTEQLCRHLAASPSPPRHFVSGSGIGYYGDGGDEILTEEATPHDEFQHRLCADWEAAADAASAWGARIIKVRTALVLGPGGGFLSPLQLPFRLGLGARLGSGRQWMSWISREDIVRVIRFALENDETSGPINACSPEPVTNATFTRTLANALNRPTFVVAPTFALKAGLGEMSRLLLASQRAVPAKLEAHGFEMQIPALRSALDIAVRDR